MEKPASEVPAIEDTISDEKLFHTNTTLSTQFVTANDIESASTTTASSRSNVFNLSDDITGTVSVDMTGSTLPAAVVPSHLPVSVQIVVTCIVSILVLVTITGNLLVIISFCRYKHLQTYNHYYILSLSIADLLVGSVCMPLYGLVFIIGYWPFNEILCDIFVFCDHAFSHFSVVSTVAISLDRFVALKKPFYHRRKWQTKRVALSLISLTYIIPTCIWLPITVLWPVFAGGRNVQDHTCKPQYVESLAVSIISPILFFWIPVTIVIILYYYVYKRIGKTLATMKLRNIQQMGDLIRRQSRDVSVINNIALVQSSDSQQTLSRNINTSGVLGAENAGFSHDETGGVVVRIQHLELSLTSQPPKTSANSLKSPGSFCNGTACDLEQNQQTSSTAGDSKQEITNTTTSSTGASKQENTKTATSTAGSSNQEITKTTTSTAGASNQEITKTTSTAGASNQEITKTTASTTGASNQEITKTTTSTTGASDQEITKTTTSTTGASDQEITKTTASTTGASNQEITKTTTSTTGASDQEITKTTTSTTGASDQEITKTTTSTAGASDQEITKTTTSTAGSSNQEITKTTASTAGASNQEITKTEQNSFKDESETKRLDSRSRIMDTRGRSESRASKMLGSIIVAMIVAWLPWAILVMIINLCNDCVPGVMYAVSVFFGYTNSTLNPFCYAITDRRFRRAFKGILCRLCTSSDPYLTTNSLYNSEVNRPIK